MRVNHVDRISSCYKTSISSAPSSTCHEGKEWGEAPGVAPATENLEHFHTDAHEPR